MFLYACRKTLLTQSNNLWVIFYVSLAKLVSYLIRFLGLLKFPNTNLIHYYRLILRRLQFEILGLWRDWCLILKFFISECHSCYLCGKRPKLLCLCCPQSVCEGCVTHAEFIHLKEDKGLCNQCQEYVVVLEEIRRYDAAGVMFQSLIYIKVISFFTHILILFLF